MIEEEEKEVSRDYEFSKDTYRNLVETGQQATEELLRICQDTEHPRAYEVLATMIKNTGDLTDKMMDLNKKRKEINKKDSPLGLPGPSEGGVTNNNVFVGTTEDLQRLLQKQDELPEKDVTPYEDDSRYNEE